MSSYMYEAYVATALSLLAQYIAFLLSFCR